MMVKSQSPQAVQKDLNYIKRHKLSHMIQTSSTSPPHHFEEGPKFVPKSHWYNTSVCKLKCRDIMANHVTKITPLLKIPIPEPSPVTMIQNGEEWAIKDTNVEGVTI